MIFSYRVPARSRLRTAIAATYRADETKTVESLLEAAAFPDEVRARIAERAKTLVQTVRQSPRGKGIEAFLLEYGLSSNEGVALMCLAESVLRVPDAQTVDELIEDKLTAADWGKHLGQSESLFVNASTWAFMLTGKLLEAKESAAHDLGTALTRLLARTSEPIIREAVSQSMRIMSRQFIMAPTIEEAIKNSEGLQTQGYRFSFDVLGEAVRTRRDADRLYAMYSDAIAEIRKHNSQQPPDAPEISVKLSALFPRYEFGQYERVMGELLPRLKALALLAKQAGIGLTLDAEEAERLELSLDLFEALVTDPDLAGWDGLGLAVQSYLKCAFNLIDWLFDLARGNQRRILVRLVKGAYWDAEIKHAQQGGYAGYTVFTRKESTDVSFIACAKKLLASTDVLYPMFATHNAAAVATILEAAGDYREFEFQRLHGMGEQLYQQIVGKDQLNVPCRIYAPCGGYKELLPYLVRRLLENGANTSFVNRIVDENVPIERIIADPLERARKHKHKPHPRIPLPRGLFAPVRQNSIGLDLHDEGKLLKLATETEAFVTQGWRAGPIINGTPIYAPENTVVDPADHRRQIGTVAWTTEQHIEQALAQATQSVPDWNATPIAERAACLARAADLLEANSAELIALCIREAGKTLANAVAEIREAVDFYRYYARCARDQMEQAYPLPGLKCEKIHYEGGRVFACISPWNFPLAIFSGQIAAALVTGNGVIAKPAEQTPLIAARAVELLHQAGVPTAVLHLITGNGEIGARIVADPRITGVAFTGSTAAAHAIRKSLADQKRGIVPLIAETGGQNAMLVDSTALPEQAIVDVLSSAFDSAGQRCSALRVLFVQEEIADRMIELIAGTMAELRIGDPALLHTDVGPIIDNDAKSRLDVHNQRMAQDAKLIYRCELAPETAHGSFFAPSAYELQSLEQLQQEHFGPLLHVIRYAAAEMDSVIAAINATGYGLTFGIHSRIDAHVKYIHDRLRVGNSYVNRNIIGAVVGVQPFGGEGLSGTGPKAGGPHYLWRFTRQQHITEALDEPMTAPSSREPSTPTVSDETWSAAPVIGGETSVGDALAVVAQDDREHEIGTITTATMEHADQALSIAFAARLQCDLIPAAERAESLNFVASQIEKYSASFIELCQLEYGFPLDKGRKESEQAGALCRAYGKLAVEEFGRPVALPGPTGETNEYRLHNRGVFVCVGSGQPSIAGWIGMIAAAVAAGNPILVLPSEYATLAGAYIFSYFRDAGLPAKSLHFLPTRSDEILSFLLQDTRIAGVAHLGDNDITYALDAKLAQREGPIIPLIATTEEQGLGGMFANPRNLYRFATARTLSINTTAAGGNASLYSIDEEVET